MSSDEPKIFFRNYKPRDPDLQKLMLPKPVIPNIEIEIDTEIIKKVNGQIDLKTVNPGRETLDLERDIQEKMETLERRTERALERFRLEAAKSSTG